MNHRGSITRSQYEESIRRRSSVLTALAQVAPSRRTPYRVLLLALICLSTILLFFHATPHETREQISTLSRSSLQRLQDSAAAAAFAAKNAVGPWKETSSCDTPEWRDAVNREGGGESLLVEEEHPHYQYPPLLHAPARGYGALSRTDNPWRERFLVPLYACNEQETGSQMHVRQLLHLAKATNRTLVLPNWGFGIPTISNCRPYSFDTIYETESTNSVGLWSVPYRTWLAWVQRKQQRTKIDARISVIFFRDTHKVLADSIATSDAGILEEGCVPVDPFRIEEPPLYIATDGQTYLSTVVNKLRETDHLQTLFVIFNHYSDFRIKGDVLFPDPLMQARPKEWGLWVGASWPQWNYSTQVNTMLDVARSKLPERYAAMQWRMELMPPKTLTKCADMFAESIISGMRQQGLSTIYVASDMPLGKDRSRSKSASFNAPEVAQARESIDHLVFRLNEASFHVRTWNDVKPKDGDEGAIDGLAEGGSGIFDKLILGKSEHLWGANPHCGFKSSFLGSIQTLRQDRIGDPTETDWDKLAVTWVGEPIKQRFWWHVKGGQL